MRSSAPLILLLVLCLSGPVRAEEHTLTVPFTQRTNLQANDPEHNPRYHYNPFIRLRLNNPETGTEQDVSGLMDTGADTCAIGEDVVARLGLRPLDGPPMRVRTGGGPISAPFVKLGYRLRNDQGTIVDTFPPQILHCLVVQDPKIPIVLGFVGFIDRFKSVTLKYPDAIEFIW